jgi:hypothetical protein
MEEQYKRVNEMHALLRRARYFYYVGVENGHDTIMSDYDYDMLEKEYDTLCARLGVPEKKMISNFVGFDYKMPMQLFYDKETKLPL